MFSSQKQKYRVVQPRIFKGLSRVAFILHLPFSSTLKFLK